MKELDYIVLGAGVSGLSCALTLQKHKANFLLLEASDSVGGRIKTRHHSEGFLIDEGFQVLLDSYPELSHVVDLAELRLHKFNSGALIYDGQKLRCLANPLVHPQYAAHSLFQDLISLKDKMLTLKLIMQARQQPEDLLQTGQTTRQFLVDFGFTPDFIQMFWEPFLTGVFLDPELKADASFFKFLVSYFSSGRVSVPENGMQQLPLQMAKALAPDKVRTKAKVKSYDQHSVTLMTGEVLKARQVIVAFDDQSDHQIADQNYYSVTTYYFTGQALAELDWDKWLVLVPRHLGYSIDHMCLLSQVSKNYASGKNLLSVSVVGSKVSDAVKVLKEVEQIAQRKLDLSLVESVEVRKALPKIKDNVCGFEVRNNIIYCGDRFASPSINGALKSGRWAAEHALKGSLNV